MYDYFSVFLEILFMSVRGSENSASGQCILSVIYLHNEQLFLFTLCGQSI